MSSQIPSGRPTTVVGALGLVAIARDDSVAHGYVDVEELRQSKNFLTGTGVEFFDSDGRRLVPVFNSAWQLTGLEPTTENPDPAGVQQRLCTMVQNVNRRLQDSSGLSTDGGDGRGPHGFADAGLVLPDVAGLSLTETLQAYMTIIGHAQDEEPPKDPGGPLHNLFHALGGTHN